MAVFIAGGAGYIGSHIAQAFLDLNQEVCVIDFNISKQRFPLDKKVLKSDLDISNEKNIDKIRQLFSHDKSKSILIHLAAFKSVSESQNFPDKYWKNNFEATKNLLASCEGSSISRLIFSSSASVYGDQTDFASEELSLSPISEYAKIKVAEENLIENYSKAMGIDFINFRYFNVAGARSFEYIDEEGENLIPSVLRAIKKKVPFEIYGIDYPTKDGTAIRDYIHVQDIVSAHLSALNSTRAWNKPINLGTESGTSVREIIQSFQRYFALEVVNSSRRAGDMPKLLADCTRAHVDLGWANQHTIDEIIDSVCI
jgi:UDP-glucose 4-epimerase